MGHMYDWIEDVIWNHVLDLEPQLEPVLDVIEFPWHRNGDWDWDPALYARKDLVAFLKDKSDNTIGEIHFMIIVNPCYGELEEPLWIIDEDNIKVKLYDAPIRDVAAPQSVS